MSKNKRAKKDSAALRREVEALKAELKNYKPEKSSVIKEQLANKSTIRPKSTNSETASTNIVKKELTRTVFATLICLAALAGFYTLRPKQERIIGFFQYGDWKSFSNWH